MASRRLGLACSQAKDVLTPSGLIGALTPHQHNTWTGRSSGGQRGFGLVAALLQQQPSHQKQYRATIPKPQKRNTLYHEEDAARASRVQDKRRAFDDESQANLFYRVLTSPIRKCQVTRRAMPRDMLICVKPVFVPEVDAPTAGPMRVSALTGLPELFLPDYIYHPSFQPKKPGKASYFCADKGVLQEVVDRKGGTLNIISSTAQLPENLTDMITFQLQQRVLQEVQLLHATSRVRPDLLLPRSPCEPGSDPTEQHEKLAALLDFAVPPPHPRGTLAESPTPSLPLYFSMPTLLQRPASTPDLHAILPAGEGDADADPHDRDGKGFLRLSPALQLSPLAEAHRLLAEVLRAAQCPRSAQAEGAAIDTPHLRIPLRPAFGPLGVALWRLEKWECSGHTEEGAGEGEAG